MQKLFYLGQDETQLADLKIITADIVYMMLHTTKNRICYLLLGMLVLQH